MSHFFKTLFPIAIDISNASVKLFQLNQHNQEITIAAYSQASLPKGIVVEDNILDSETLSYVLRQQLEKPQYGAFSGKRVVASLPESKSFLRVIHLPSMTDMEIDQAIPFEAESYIPVPIDQVYLDWQKLNEQNNRMAILLVATPKDTVDKTLNVFTKLGLSVQALEVESMSVTRAIFPPAAEPTVLVADMNDHKTNLFILEKGKLLFSSSIPIGGNMFTDALAKQLSMSPENAEQLKMSAGVSNTPDYPNLKLSLLPLVKNLASEINNVLTFQSEHFQIKIEKVVLAGGGARLKNLTENLEPELSILKLHAELANPLINLSPASLKILNVENAVSFATAIGLALRNNY